MSKPSTQALSKAAIQDWLSYWSRGGMVAVDNIRAFDQVYTARKFCRCMRVGIFHPDLVTDLSIWNAIVAMRGDAA